MKRDTCVVGAILVILSNTGEQWNLLVFVLLYERYCTSTRTITSIVVQVLVPSKKWPFGIVGCVAPRCSTSTMTIARPLLIVPVEMLTASVGFGSLTTLAPP